MCYLTPQTITPESDCSCWTETPTLTTSTPITLTWVFTHTNTHSGYQSRFTQWAKSHLFLLETNYLDVGTIISMRVHYRCSLFYLFLLHRSLISSSISFVPNCFPLLHSSSPIPHVSFHPSISVFPPLLSALGRCASLIDVISRLQLTVVMNLVQIVYFQSDSTDIFFFFFSEMRRKGGIGKQKTGNNTSPSVEIKS